MKKSRLFIIACGSLFVLACGSDEAAQVDAAATVADAAPGAADADPAVPDADPTVPDADPTAPDADPSVPDADPTAPDASAVDASSSQYPIHIITSTCAPNDGAALRISLGDETDANCRLNSRGASLELHLWVGDVSAPETITFSESDLMGSGTMCPGGMPPCRVAVDGEVHFETFSTSTGATGSWKLTFGDTSEEGTFAADWCAPEVPVICG